MRIGFTGTSTKDLSAAQLSELMWTFSQLPGTVLVHGGCIHADDMADKLAAKMGIDREVHPASNVASCKRIDPNVLRARSGSRVTIMRASKALERNRVIVRGSDILLAMPGSPIEALRSGTWMTVRFAREHWKNDLARVRVVAP